MKETLLYKFFQRFFTFLNFEVPPAPMIQLNFEETLMGNVLLFGFFNRDVSISDVLGAFFVLSLRNLKTLFS